MPELRDGALLAPARLTGMVRRHLAESGLRLRPSDVAVVPRREPGRPNAVLDRRVDRWVAGCPECPGFEVVPEVGPFVCGSCGVQCRVDWDGV